MRRKKLVIAAAAFFAAALLVGFYYFSPCTISDFLPQQQPSDLQLFALEQPGTAFYEMEIENSEQLYHALSGLKIQRKYIPENYFAAYARYSIYLHFRDFGTYEMIYYPDVESVEIYHQSKRIVAAEIRDTQGKLLTYLSKTF